MSIFIPANLTRTLPLGAFEAVCQLLQQMAQLPGTSLLTQDAIAPTDAIAAQLPQRFTLFVSERFSALLWAKTEGQSGKELFSIQNPKFKVKNLIVPNTLLNVGLSFDADAIASFGYQLCDIHAAEGIEWSTPIGIQALRNVLQKIKPNDAAFQSEFTLQLLEIVAAQNCKTTQDLSACKSVQETFHPQLEQERLLNQVTTQIRQSLELPAILSTAVEQLRQFLQVDRLLIYQFEDREKDTGESDNKLPLQGAKNRLSKKLLGRVTYEALANEKITSVLNLTEGLDCFPDVPNHREKYRKGLTKGVADIETAYRYHSCFLEFMRLCQVRAKLVVPIVVQEELWGLMIAHQCFKVREWEESKKTFLRQIAQHLAIAIYQAELYAELQQQKHTLEQRVIERTQELQDALAAAQSANITKTEFLATVSHELRTPLTCVIGISATLLRWSFGKEGNKILPVAKQQSYLQTIHDSGKHLLDLIEDILDLSQVEAGNILLKMGELSLSQLAYITVRALKEQAAAKQIALAIEQQIEPGRDRVAGDQRRLKQILFNLLTNAIKFTPKGGKVTLRIWVESETIMSPVRQNSVKARGATAVFQVEDTGIGIAEEQQKLLFQKFTQLDSPYRREYSGIGLGLALTKQLVELHGGVIEVKSTVGVGSIFTAFIPVQPIKKDEFANS